MATAGEYFDDGMNAETILQEALKLPQEQREKLRDRLDQSLMSEDQEGDEQAEIITQRLTAHQERPEEVISREELEAKWLVRWSAGA
ncbi:hypothetical protein FEM03_08220 [Phragmitibacter flavus]|uniref:Addiction module protein n=1 Tax=Phragmitibacter flavus TaxID=2576071 RepID=A0A5R8KIQ9_9BACT|nr:hypothetical protein [Phragmitibacter flavus]TLD71499.1 hypothetical protein FEM03_08220 [Phragmitibacter flavus]